MKHVKTLVFCLLLFQLAIGQSPSWQDTVGRIEKAFSDFKPGHPGCELAISRNGQVIYSHAWGMADLERRVPLTTQSVLEVGSVSKQFTAAAILLLEQQGKLSLDDDVRKYIPELPDYGHPIRLRQMLHHTSGLRDWGAIAELSGWPRTKQFYTNDDALAIIVRQRHLNHAPGDEYLYSNSNYNLFAIIVQRVSGQTLAEFTRQLIFQPAGMSQTQWRDDPNRIVAGRAIAYITSDNFLSDSTYKIDMPNEYAYGNGGLLTTAEDLLKWNDFYLQGHLGKPSLLPRQLETAPLNNGAMSHYAAGLDIGQVMGWKSIGHSGATASYCAYLEGVPDLQLSIAIITNTSEYSVFDLKGRIENIFLPLIKQRTEKTPVITLPDEALQRRAGMYLNQRDGSTFILAVKDHQLVLDGYMKLNPLSPDSYQGDGFKFLFNGSDGTYLPASPADTIHFKKMIPVNPSRDVLKTYTGTYYSDETQSHVVVGLDSSGLRIRLSTDRVYPLAPTYQDAFELKKLGYNLHFTKNANGQITTMIVDSDRARRVEFKRAK